MEFEYKRRFVESLERKVKSTFLHGCVRLNMHTNPFPKRVRTLKKGGNVNPCCSSALLIFHPQNLLFTDYLQNGCDFGQVILVSLRFLAIQPWHLHPVEHHHLGRHASDEPSVHPASHPVSHPVVGHLTVPSPSVASSHEQIRRPTLTADLHLLVF
ncbi:hypothetical protein L1987_48631 [Smallanthus sonchifolius]|uniref:Uncharacterized protein n=1 Tax=Smallanthus sonchifolius TaxID=185202 RepID=A0ACB9FT49_9ASTR|nr:hypothetical protein L1987_48631 [Smallanthus sonchifolius]